MQGIDITLTNVHRNEEKLDTLVQEMVAAIRSQQKTITELEDRSRRNNLLVFRIPEAVSETTDDLKKKMLQDVFHERLVV